MLGTLYGLPLQVDRLLSKEVTRVLAVLQHRRSKVSPIQQADPAARTTTLLDDGTVRGFRVYALPESHVGG